VYQVRERRVQSFFAEVGGISLDNRPFTSDSAAAMVKEKGRLIGIGIFEPDEHFSTLDNPAALCAPLYFRHCFRTYRRLEQAFAMLMGDTLASQDRRILVLRLELVTRAVDRMKVPGTRRLRFQFFAQSQDVVIDSPCRRIVLVSPDLTEQFVP
jgi:hypothetical protein